MLKKVLKLFPRIFIFLRRARKRMLMHSLKPMFRHHGRNFLFDPDDRFSYDTISVGDDVFVGSGAMFSASETTISIGNKVMFGPNVTLMGGDHNTREVGKFMYDVHEKLPENDQPIIVEDDVWIGAGVIVLKGVTIGNGSVVAAGAVVTKSIPPFSIAGGVPAKVIRKRFTEDELKRHKQILGGKK
jgi:acetyltransferase-like isoleucine patch superfamily enzyme